MEFLKDIDHIDQLIHICQSDKNVHQYCNQNKKQVFKELISNKQFKSSFYKHIHKSIKQHDYSAMLFLLSWYPLGEVFSQEYVQLNFFQVDTITNLTKYDHQSKYLSTLLQLLFIPQSLSKINVTKIFKVHDFIRYHHVTSDSHIKLAKLILFQLLSLRKSKRLYTFIIKHLIKAIGLPYQYPEFQQALLNELSKIEFNIVMSLAKKHLKTKRYVSFILKDFVLQQSGGGLLSKMKAALPKKLSPDEKEKQAKAKKLEKTTQELKAKQEKEKQKAQKEVDDKRKKELEERNKREKQIQKEAAKLKKSPNTNILSSNVPRAPTAPATTTSTSTKTSAVKNKFSSLFKKSPPTLDKQLQKAQLSPPKSSIPEAPPNPLSSASNTTSPIKSKISSPDKQEPKTRLPSSYKLPSDDKISLSNDMSFLLETKKHAEILDDKKYLANINKRINDILSKSPAIQKAKLPPINTKVKVETPPPTYTSPSPIATIVDKKPTWKDRLSSAGKKISSAASTAGKKISSAASTASDKYKQEKKVFSEQKKEFKQQRSQLINKADNVINTKANKTFNPISSKHSDNKAQFKQDVTKLKQGLNKFFNNSPKKNNVQNTTDDQTSSNVDNQNNIKTSQNVDKQNNVSPETNLLKQDIYKTLRGKYPHLKKLNDDSLTSVLKSMVGGASFLDRAFVSPKKKDIDSQNSSDTFQDSSDTFQDSSDENDDSSDTFEDASETFENNVSESSSSLAVVPYKGNVSESSIIPYKGNVSDNVSESSSSIAVVPYKGNVSDNVSETTSDLSIVPYKGNVSDNVSETSIDNASVPLPPSLSSNEKLDYLPTRRLTLQPEPTESIILSKKGSKQLSPEAQEIVNQIQQLIDTIKNKKLKIM